MRLSLPHILIAILLVFVSCKTATMKQGNEQMERGEYYAAARTYRKVIGKTSGKDKAARAEAYFRMGRAYQLHNQIPRAESAYNYAIKSDCNDSTVYLYMGQVKQKSGRWKDGAHYFETYLRFDSTHLSAQNGYMMCQKLEMIRRNPTRYTVRMAPVLNYSAGSDYSTSFMGQDGTKIFFASTRRQAKGKGKSDITGQKNADIFYSQKDDKGRWSKPKAIDSDINSENDEGVMSLTGDGLRMYFTRSRNIKEAVTEICYAQRIEDQWGKPQVLKLTKDSLTAVAHPSISADGGFLYFVSDMPGGSGGLDIWRAKMGTDEVMYIENLGPEINTSEDEMFPFIREDGTLYFASRGWPGLGGLDIFKASVTSAGSWKVENMGMPVNSTGDDFGISYFGPEEKGFFSSDRGNSRGYDKLYTFELPELKCFFEGNVRGERKVPLKEARIHIVGDSGYYEKQPVRQDATYQFKIRQGEKYAVQASCPGYLSVAEYFTPPKQDQDYVYRKEFVLMPVAKTIRVDNIFFDFNQATLRPESKGALDYLIMILNENPNITIELSSHTDIIGSDTYNMDLSNRRAKSVVDYLIDSGVDKERLTPRGYGKTVPVVVDDDMADLYPFLQYGDILSEDYIRRLPADQEEIARQLSRRTEFKVLRTDYNLY